MLRKAGLFVGLLALAISGSLAGAQDSFTLTILHTNDTHAYHEPQSNGNGGAARQAAVQKQVLAEGGNVILLDAGDRYTGTLYHTVYLGEDQVQMMNALGYDAMTLGNHEFDNGDDVLLTLLNGVEFPVVSANIDLSANPDVDALVDPYTILEVGGQQIGVIGLTTATTVFSSSPNDAYVFSDDYAGAANAAAQELTEAGVNKIILLTHLGIQDELPLLSQLSNIDIVLGGHSHTLFSNAYAGAADRYPVRAEDADGNPIYYAQAGQYNIYLGRLDVTFDAEGLITAIGGDVILLSRYITPDAEIEGLLASLQGPVDELREQPIGATASQFLDGDRTVCRIEECALGNLIADALRAETGAQIGLMNGGGVRADIEEGEITLGEVLTVHPFGNTVSTFSASGAVIRAALENSVSAIRLNEAGQIARAGGSGRFLQVSGLRFSYDPKAEPGSRVVSVEVQQADGTFAPLDDAAIYTVATNNFTRTGGDGYTMFANEVQDAYDFGRVDYEVTADYLASLGTVSSPVDPANPRITAVGVEVEPRN
jgi:5'-nucleotidase